MEKVFAERRREPEYVKAYDALEEEFALAAALIEARAPGCVRPDPQGSAVQPA